MLKGSKTAENLMKSFAGGVKQEPDIRIIQVLLKRKDIFK